MMDITELKKQFSKELGEVRYLEDLGKIRVKYLGKKSELYKILGRLGEMSPEERKAKGRELNTAKKEIIFALSNKEKFFLEEADTTKVDFSEPGKNYPVGHLHPITHIYNELFEISKTLGFSIATGPDIETDWYNFEALNMPPEHPARDTQDSFYINDKLLLRTHTSPVQVRYLEKNKPPVRVVVYGRTYRRDSDLTHTPMFHQMEGLLVDESVRFTDLKGILTEFVKRLFGKEREVRFRPHHFPFTEPSAEVDVSCGLCGGKGCRSCKFSGWLEILGSGMVHPNVLKNAGIDPSVYQGFAFGMGIERIAMLKYNIDDLRLFYENDLRFLEQF